MIAPMYPHTKMGTSKPFWTSDLTPPHPPNITSHAELWNFFEHQPWSLQIPLRLPKLDLIMEIFNISDSSLRSVRLPWRSSSLWWRMVLFRVYMVLFVYLQVYLRTWTTWLREPAQRSWRSSSMGWRDSSTEDTTQLVRWPSLVTLTLITAVTLNHESWGYKFDGKKWLAALIWFNQTFQPLTFLCIYEQSGIPLLLERLIPASHLNVRDAINLTY